MVGESIMADYKILYEARNDVVASAEMMFQYLQKLSHKIEYHRLETLLPKPNEVMDHYIKAIDKSRDIHREEM